MKLQANTTILGAPEKYEGGASLIFLGVAKDELPVSFSPGDRLRVGEVNGCGMGIDVTRADGVTDMVWPDEVECIEGDGCDCSSLPSRADPALAVEVEVTRGIRDLRIAGDAEWTISADNDPITARVEADAALTAAGWRRA